MFGKWYPLPLKLEKSRKMSIWAEVGHKRWSDIWIAVGPIAKSLWSNSRLPITTRTYICAVDMRSKLRSSTERRVYLLRSRSTMTIPWAPHDVNQTELIAVRWACYWPVFRMLNLCFFGEILRWTLYPWKHQKNEHLPPAVSMSRAHNTSCLYHNKRHSGMSMSACSS